MKKILIIEDDPLMQRMYQIAFSAGGFDVDIASDGQEGLEKSISSSPNLILLDVMMPKVNGFEVLDRLKNDEITKGIPVIMLTNLSVEKDAETAVSKGALKYLVKSDYEPNQVLDIVKQILQ
jgi:CheY-like chemotaxis protein